MVLHPSFGNLGRGSIPTSSTTVGMETENPFKKSGGHKRLKIKGVRGVDSTKVSDTKLSYKRHIQQTFITKIIGSNPMLAAFCELAELVNALD